MFIDTAVTPVLLLFVVGVVVCVGAFAMHVFISFLVGDYEYDEDDNKL